MKWNPPEITNNGLTEWNWMVTKPENLKLGRHTDIGAFTYIQASQGVIIEDHVQIGSRCGIYSISTIDGKQGAITIRKNARIGTGSTIMPGVTIGRNSVIGAHSFVTCNIPDNEMWFGVPAHYVRSLTPS